MNLILMTGIFNIVWGLISAVKSNIELSNRLDETTGV